MPVRFIRPFFSSRSSRSPFAFALLLAPLALAAGVLLCPAPARAQLDVQSAVVLDFEVFTGLDPNLGRKAADALAVELQTSTANEPVPRQRIEIVPRARVEQVINDTTALTPPFTDIIQLRLARATGASSVFSGRILSATVADRQAARVTLELMQFDVSMQDYANGAVVSQSAIDRTGRADNDLLLDEAINKAVYAALIELERRPYPIGTIQIVTKEYALSNLGARNGVSRGQKYAVLRDIYRGRDTTDRDVVERVKIGEAVATRLDVDQSTIVLTVGGAAGVKIGDKLRRIYVPYSFRPRPRDTDARVVKYLTADQLVAEETAEAIRREDQLARQQEELARQAEQAARQRAKRR